MTETLDIKITKTTNSRLAQTDFSNLPFGKIFSDHMFVADYADGEWKNLQVVPYGDISFSPAISSLHYGQSFFEGIKAYKHADGQVSVFRPDKNAVRFNKSAERLCMPTLPEEIFLQSMAAVIDIDRDWIPAIAKHLSSRESTLIIVGCMHLAGPDSLPELLEQQGFRLRLISY